MQRKLLLKMSITVSDLSSYTHERQLKQSQTRDHLVIYFLCYKPIRKTDYLLACFRQAKERKVLSVLTI